ncbi:VCBS repeat-containing protein [Flavihumibacter profundi]|uniref:VCBS repeat-containing protein n=1 Tax=Flavihumibacter profundi TaxID=2716883 RepID=UPI001CC78A9E|nr:VCBS repeat-containing protein [Flavihumibacter profundi]MBZ5859412.1 VCBS repeat-containing protein [Flavihumibacter profundi]
MKSLYLLFTLLVLNACSGKKDAALLFTEIPASHSHIDFRNDIKETVDYNIDTYEYLYNGGGVATGDLNGDGLQDIVLGANMSPDRIYLNKGNLQFEDITENCGFQSREKWKTGIAIADINGDHLPDIYLCYSGPGTDEDRTNELYLNTGITNGIPHFREAAKEYGLDAPGTFTTMVNFFDMDNDGDLDMFMVNHADMFYNPFFNSEKLRKTRHPKFGNRLYRNDNGHFTDISEQANIDGSGLNFGLSCAISDLNNDGWPDIYVTNDYDERDFLYLNNQNGSFREVLNTAARHISEFSMGSDIADYNNDGKPDIMVLDMLPEDNYRQKTLKGPDNYDKYMLRLSLGFQRQQMRNTLQLNNGNDKNGVPIFSEIGQLAGVSNTDWSWSPLFADFDNDGWKDLFVSNGVLRDMTNLDFVKYGQTYSSKSKSPLQDKTKMWEQISQMPTPALHNYIYRNNHDLSFTNSTAAWGIQKDMVSNGAIYADLDNDGDLDLVINNLNSEASLYQNNASGKRDAHFLKIRLEGDRQNTQGIGAKVLISAASAKQLQEQYLSRGFQSSVDAVMHIGLGKDSVVNDITVRWPGGKVSHVQNLKADTTLVIKENTAIAAVADTIPEDQSMFADITEQSGIDYTHQESGFVDFSVNSLLPFQLSKTGPCLAKADVNHDGLEDLFIGATAKQESKLYLQHPDGRFSVSPSEPWNSKTAITNTDALFFDADRDGDPDLYLVSGGAEYMPGSKNYQDRIFENDGKGNFREVDNALPAETVSGACARAADIDKDGLPDLFIGGMNSPGQFPVAPESYILKNKSRPGSIHFEKEDAMHYPSLNRIGMVTDAVWVDMNKDGWEDLVVVGQFMPIHLFINQQGTLLDKSADYGLAETNGWWRRLFADDLDGDGDIDFIAGNIGLNSPFKASSQEPISITYGSFYTPGVINPIFCYYNGGVNYPWNSKDELASQVPTIQQKFLRYEEYGKAGLSDIFTKEQLAKSKTIKAKMLQSIYLQNNGNNTFTIIPLPLEAQVSAIHGIIPFDYNNDGKKDLLIGGNLYPFRVQTGPLDASIGLVLKGNGTGQFTPLTYSQTGLLIDGDVRNIISLKTKNGSAIIAAKNNGKVQVLTKRGKG